MSTHPEPLPSLGRPYHEEAGVAIYLGDSCELLPLVPDSSVDFIFTDPPYGHNNNNGDLIHRREQALGLVKRGVAESGEARPIANDGFDDANRVTRSMFAEAARILKPGCCCCCCCCGGGGPDPQFARWSLWMDEEIGFKQAVVWDKGGLGMGWHYRRNYELVLVGQRPGAACRWFGGNDQANVVRVPGIKPAATDHPTPKPEALVRLFIGLHTEPGDLVVDPFLGGGTTLRVAKDMGRPAIGIEVEERWAEMAARRLSQEVIDWNAA